MLRVRNHPQPVDALLGPLPCRPHLDSHRGSLVDAVGDDRHGVQRHLGVQSAFRALPASEDHTDTDSLSFQWTTTYYVLPDKLSLLPWELTANCFVMSTSIVLAQHFYLYRLFSLSGKNWLVAAPVSVAALGCWGVAIYMGWFCSKHPNDIAAYADITCVCIPPLLARSAWRAWSKWY